MKCVACARDQRPLYRDLYICECRLISSKYKADNSIYDEFYKDRYVEYKDAEIGRKLLELRTSQIYRHIRKGTLLDYGCATGEFHQSLNGGIIGHGYDVNPYYGFPKKDIVNPYILTMWDCIEHLDYPQNVIQIFNPAFLFVSTPSTDDFKGKDLGQWRHYRPHEHVHYFNEASLKTFFDMNAYEVLETNYDESKIRKSGGDRNILTMIGRKRGSN